MILPLVLALPASADTPIPTWSWPTGQEERFHIETEIVTPRGTRYYAIKNVDARAGDVKVRGDTACTAKPEGKARVVTCTFAYVKVAGVPWTPEEGPKLDHVLEEWSADLAATKIELVLGPDGHLRSFDVTPGKEADDLRQGQIDEAERVLLQRVFCVFDLPITTDAKDWVRGWSQKGDNAIMQMQVIGGTAGAVDMKHTHNGERDGYTVIETEAHATLSAGAALDASSGSRLVDVRMAGETLFDAQLGMLAWRDFTVDGRLTVSAQEAGSAAEYYQQTAIEHVEEFPAPGEAPLTLAAMKAPRLDVAPPAPADGVAVVPFTDLGMTPLFVSGFPESVKAIGFPKTTVSARVFVGKDGVPASVKAFKGYAALAGPTEQALAAARFPARAADYAVDVDVEWRPAE